MQKIISRSEAKSLGLKKYFTGKLCKHKHISPRAVANGTCIECATIARQTKTGLIHEIEAIKSMFGSKLITRSEARSGGLKRYFTGKPCPRGHIDSKYTSNGKCVSCATIERVEYFKDKDKSEIPNTLRSRALASKRYAANNPEKRKDSCSIYYLANKTRCKERKHKYRAASLMATPAWSSQFLRSEMQRLGSYLSLSVDHIVPLQSDFVCGFHCHTNMQLITRSENSSKGNRYWPDMPNTKDPELLKLVEEFKNVSI